MSKKIQAWLKPEYASVLYECDMPDNWNKMNAGGKFEYFEMHMTYADKTDISIEADPDWYDGLCCSGDDFNIVKRK